MKHLDLFSGIGGFALAAERVWPDIEHTFCDNDEFCQEVLKKHWPKAKIYGDIRGLTADTERERQLQSQGSKQNKRERTSDIDILTGGFPCQPFSQAGRRRGTEDDRFLWPEMLRVIREFRPRWIIGENVAGLLTIEQGVVFEQVCADLEAEGYEVQSFVIPAVAVNAPHRRDRVWIVANRKHRGNRRGEQQSTQGGQETRRDTLNAPDPGQQYGSEGRDERVETDTTIGTARSKDTERCGEDVTDTGNERLERGKQEWQRHGGLTDRIGSYERSGWDQNWLEVATRLCRVDDGVPRRMDRNPRLKTLGNAIVPALAEEIFKAIKAIDS